MFINIFGYAQPAKRKIVTQHVFPVNGSGAILCLTVSAATAHEDHFQFTHCQATCKPFLFIYDIYAKNAAHRECVIRIPSHKKTVILPTEKT